MTPERRDLVSSMLCPTSSMLRRAQEWGARPGMTLIRCVSVEVAVATASPRINLWASLGHRCACPFSGTGGRRVFSSCFRGLAALQNQEASMLGLALVACGGVESFRPGSDPNFVLGNWHQIRRSVAAAVNAMQVPSGADERPLRPAHMKEQQNSTDCEDGPLYLAERRGIGRAPEDPDVACVGSEARPPPTSQALADYSSHPPHLGALHHDRRRRVDRGLRATVQPEVRARLHRRRPPPPRHGRVWACRWSWAI